MKILLCHDILNQSYDYTGEREVLPLSVLHNHFYTLADSKFVLLRTWHNIYPNKIFDLLTQVGKKLKNLFFLVLHLYLTRNKGRAVEEFNIKNEKYQFFHTVEEKVKCSNFYTPPSRSSLHFHPPYYRFFHCPTNWDIILILCN